MRARPSAWTLFAAPQTCAASASTPCATTSMALRFGSVELETRSSLIGAIVSQYLRRKLKQRCEQFPRERREDRISGVLYAANSDLESSSLAPSGLALSSWTCDEELDLVLRETLASMSQLPSINTLSLNEIGPEGIFRLASTAARSSDSWKIFAEHKKLMQKAVPAYRSWVRRSGIHLDESTLYERLARELRLEAMAKNRGNARYFHMKNELIVAGRFNALKPYSRLLLRCLRQVLPPMQEFLHRVSDDRVTVDDGIRRNLDLLQMCPVETMAIVTTQHVLEASSTNSSIGGVPTSDLVRAIGRAVNVEAVTEREMHDRQAIRDAKSQSKSSNRNNQIVMVPRKYFRRTDEWTDEELSSVGGTLLAIFLDSVRIPVSVYRELIHDFRRLSKEESAKINDQWNRIQGTGTMAPFAFKKVKNEHLTGHGVNIRYTTSWNVLPHSIISLYLDRLRATERDAFLKSSPEYLPMVVPPRPWTASRVGGFITLPNRVVRASLTENNVFDDDLPQDVIRALNILSELPWKVDEKVLGVIEALWEEGGGVAEIPIRKSIESLGENIENVSGKYSDLSDEDKLKRRTYSRAVSRLQQKRRDEHSLRCNFELKLSIARLLRNDPELFFPHNVDFRGRAYPIPPHLNHMGPDLCRGLLRFAKSHPLGAKGVYWLKLHTANVCGQDKLSLEDRVAWTDNNYDKLLEIAADPLKHRWWTELESPFQALSACFELHRLQEWKGRIEDFPSTLPIQQDGSCNGLQHYAGLGRDLAGGISVNLTPSDRPHDVYMSVCHLVQKRVAEDAELGVELAIALNGKIDRKIVKQTVMTSVYGVTFVGAREQIRKRLAEREDIVLPEPIDESSQKASSYLARITLDGLKKMFTNARNIMEWLATCSTLVARNSGQRMSWLTPLGMPVTQPYRREEYILIKTLLQKVKVKREDSFERPVAVSKQRTAFPPNFVHSIDSTHMMMTALQCQKEGLCFAAVHDSYWTHAGSVDEMNRILRDKFVELHSQPILESLRDQLHDRYPSIQFPPVPERGDLNLEVVRDAKYFFN